MLCTWLQLVLGLEVGKAGRMMHRVLNQHGMICSLCFSAGALGKAPSNVMDALPEPELRGATAASEEEEEEEEEALEAMQSRLATLRS